MFSSVPGRDVVFSRVLRSLLAPVALALCDADPRDTKNELERRLGLSLEGDGSRVPAPVIHCR